MRLKATSLLLVLLASLLLLTACSAALESGPGANASEAAASSEGEASNEEGPLVVRLYLMSRCPHCARAVEALVPIARELGAQMRLEVEYLGEVQGEELASLHGEAEVLGDLIELCVHRNATYSQWLEFLECYHQRWRDIPDGLDDCAQQADLDNLAPVARCVEDGSGQEALGASFRRSTEAGVRAAPSISVGAITIVGAREGTELAQVICAQYDQEALPPMCELVDPLIYVPVTILTDERCEHPGCDVSEATAGLREVIWGASIHEIDVQSEPGQAIFRAARLKRLPALLIGAELEDDAQAYRQLKGMRRAGGYYVKTLGRFDPVEARWVPRQKISTRVLTDSRCPVDRCRTTKLERSVAAELPAAVLERVDYDSEAGRALHRSLVKAAALERLMLPALLFGETLTDDDELFEGLSPDLIHLEEGYLLPLGDWDPTVELCDNGRDDDDDDELADCQDPDCSGQWSCRPEQVRRLELFAMSQCPFATSVFSQMKTVVEHFGRERSKIDFRVRYIGEVDEQGELHSMHGAEEVSEDLRQVCIQQHYRAGYAFVDYLACRAPAYRSDEWEQCAGAPLDVALIRRCAEGDEGRRLLRASYEETEALGITGSPSWMLNNQHRMRARSARDIIDAYCEHNSLSECQNPVPEEEEGVSTPEPAAQGGCGGP